MKKSKFLYMLPSILICLMICLYPAFNIYIDLKKVSSPYMGIGVLIYLLVLILLSLIALYQLTMLIRFVIKSDWSIWKKILWISFLIIFNLLAIPYFYSKFINQDRNIIIRSLAYLIPIMLFVVIYFQGLNYYYKELKRIEDEKKAIEAERYYFGTKDGVVSFMFRHGYVQKTNEPESGEYDIYVIDEDETVSVHGFTYETEKYVEQTADDFLNKAINDIAAVKQEFNMYKDKEVLSFGDKVITTVTYEGKDASSDPCMYIISIIDFNEKDNYLVYLVEVVTKNKYKEKLPILEEILQSAKLN